MTRMKSIALIAAFSSLFAAPVLANTAGLVEGPPGCHWNAEVEQSGLHNGIMSSRVELKTYTGKCMYEPGECGHVGDKIFVPLGDRIPEEYDHGRRVDIWITKKTATFDIPACLSPQPANQ